MKNLSLKIKDFMSFGETPQGFDQLRLVNLIIGRNNTGKSALLDLVAYAASPHDLSAKGHKGRKPEVFLAHKLSEDEVKRVFPPGTSGGVIRGDHWAYGRRWVDSMITWRESPNGNREFISHVPELDISHQEEKNRLQHALVKVKNYPLKDKKVKRLLADRDLSPELDQSSDVMPDGRGAMTLIQRFINKTSLPSDLVEKKMLDELNKIVYPDICFTDIVVQQDDATGLWEVFLEEENKGRVALSKSGSGLKTVILVLVYLWLIPHSQKISIRDYVFCFEELENNLHPALQRRLFLYVDDFARQYGCHFFLTTHSNVVIDLFTNDDNAQLVHVTHDGNNATVRNIKAYLDKRNVLVDLDIRASDLLQSNGVVWVEGPSDRVYVNRWIELLTNGRLREGNHYQCVFYGGKLLSHLSGSSSPQTDEFLKLLLVNRNAAILIDRDRDNPSVAINETKTRIVEEFENNNQLHWVTDGREIENYVSVQALRRLYPDITFDELPLFVDFADYMERCSPGLGKKFEKEKPTFAQEVCAALTADDIRLNTVLTDRLLRLCRVIAGWNGLSAPELNL